MWSLAVGAVGGLVVGGACGVWITERYGEGPDLIVNVPGCALVGMVVGGVIGALA